MTVGAYILFPAVCIGDVMKKNYMCCKSIKYATRTRFFFCLLFIGSLIKTEPPWLHHARGDQIRGGGGGGGGEDFYV